MRIKIKHSIPGRLRIKVSALRGDIQTAEEVERLLKKSPLISRLEVRPSTGSVIMLYEPEKTCRKELLGLLEGWKDHFLRAGDIKPTGIMEKTVPAACGLECRKCRPGKDAPSLLKQAAGLIFLTGYVVYVFIRKTIFKAPVSESALSITSLVAGIGAWPLIRHAWQDLSEGCHKSLFPFLTGTFALAILLGEALTALEVIWILRLGMLLEDYVAERSRKAIREILQLAEKNTYIVVDGVEVEVAADQVKKGDLVVCHTGEKIPVDGMITDGEALVDESPITGRAEPEERRVDDRVFAGTIVCQGVVFIKAEKVGDATYLCRILHMVENSLNNRSPAENRADILANRLMRIGAVTVAGTLLITMDPMRAFTVLLVLACPCATVLAASTAVSAALANAARNHILVKGGLYLEKTGDADCFCFDKTGTITSDIPELVKVIPRTHTQEPDSILGLAAAAEAHNQHPVAKALLSAAAEKNLNVASHAVCEFILGKGVRARIDHDEILVGNGKMMADEKINTNWFSKHVQEEIRQGNTAVFVAKNKKIQGMLVVANAMRPQAEKVLEWLRKDHVRELHLISGDTQPVVREMAGAFGFDGFQGDLLPEEKAAYIENLEARGKHTIMVGDGINDAMALAKASIGIAMGAGGAEVAIEAADVALVDSDLERLVRLRKLSHQTIAVIEQNHMLAMVTNMGGVFLGAAGLLSPIMAGALHIVHTLGILLNSGRLLAWDAPGISENRERKRKDRKKHESEKQ